MAASKKHDMSGSSLEKHRCPYSYPCVQLFPDTNGPIPRKLRDLYATRLARVMRLGGSLQFFAAGWRLESAERVKGPTKRLYF